MGVFRCAHSVVACRVLCRRHPGSHVCGTPSFPIPQARAYNMGDEIDPDDPEPKPEGARDGDSEDDDDDALGPGFARVRGMNDAAPFCALS